MKWRGLDDEQDPNFPHLGGNIKSGDPFSFAPATWRYLTERFAVRSVLDVGSGRGYAGNFLFNMGLAVTCIDGLPRNVKAAIYPTVLHDLCVAPFITRVDFVHCQEVVEHIAEEHVQNIVDTFRSGHHLAFSHGEPGQPGFHHVNLQSADYWIRLLEAQDFVFLEEDTDRIRSIARSEGAAYLAKTGLVFANRKRA